MSILLFPGRHLLTTQFQEDYLRRKFTAGELLQDKYGPNLSIEPITQVVFAITSANHANSRFNPIPLEMRAIGLDRFVRDVCVPAGVGARLVPIPHYAPTGRFADFLLKEIAQHTEGELVLTPENTRVLCSTPKVIEQFLALGFQVLPAELSSLDPPRYRARTPLELLTCAVELSDPLADPVVAGELSGATRSLWRDFPDILRRVARMYHDPILTQEGSLTEFRNYSTYAQGMNERAILEIKYRDIKDAILPGRIVDEGCADGALLVPIARDFPDSDLMGIEITGEFLARCLERQRALEYGGTFIHFHQRNIMESIFQPGTIDTTICNSTTHELWSYGKQEKTLRPYLGEKYRQLRRGGRLIVRDVVGPEDPERTVHLWCNDADGSNADVQKHCATAAEVTAHVAGLSTAARFERFAEDFLADMRKSGQREAGTKIRYERVVRDGKTYFQMRMRDAMEFLMKKDYCDNWSSELNEEFCFWSFEHWQSVLREEGFTVMPGSRAYTSEWIAKNRFEGKVALFEMGNPTPLPWPVTNMVLLGQK